MAPRSRIGISVPAWRRALAGLYTYLAGLTAARALHLRDVIVMLAAAEKILKFAFFDAHLDPPPQNSMVATDAA